MGSSPAVELGVRLLVSIIDLLRTTLDRRREEVFGMKSSCRRPKMVAFIILEHEFLDSELGMPPFSVEPP
jgi:hypothetical protein